MKNTVLLDKNDIVGQTITDLVHSAWVEIEGIKTCRHFICLENGHNFELLAQEPMKTYPVKNVRLGFFGIRTERSHLQPCVMHCRVRNLLTSEMWPTIGVLLQSPDGILRVLFCAEQMWSNSLEVTLVELCRLNLVDIVTYWEHAPLGESVSRTK